MGHSAQDNTLIDTICERISLGETFRKVCESLGVNKGTVWRILQGNDALRTQYARAREVQVEAFADEILEIADNPLIGIETTMKADGSVETMECDMLGRRKLQIETRKWLLSKILPKTYGNRPVAAINNGQSAGGKNNFVLDAATISKLQERRRIALMANAKPMQVTEVEGANPARPT